MGGLGLLTLLLLARMYMRADPHTLAVGLRTALIFVCIVGGVLLLATGRFGFIFIPIGAMGAVLAASRQRPAAGTAGGGNRNARTSSGAMTRAEALKVLGLSDGASEEQIVAAHRKLIMQNHPDRGGSTYLAAKINQAKDVLLGK